MLSIITVVKNGMDTLERTIKSVLGQDYDDIEYIIIDGGSNDGTVDVIKKYENDLAFWISEEDGGIYDAMNKGISHARGDIVGIINSDDWYEPDVFGSVINTFNREKCDIVFGNMRFFKRGGFIIEGCTNPDISNIEKGQMIPHPTVFVKKQTYTRFGVFRTDFRLISDYELMLRFLRSGCSFSYIPRVLVNFSWGGESNGNVMELWEEKITVMKEHAELVPEHRKNTIRNWINEYVALEYDNYKRASVLNHIIKNNKGSVMREIVYKMTGNRRISLFGAGNNLSEILSWLYIVLNDNLDLVDCIFDNNPQKNGSMIYDICVSLPKDRARKGDSYIIVTLSSKSPHIKNILNQMRDLHYEQEDYDLFESFRDRVLSEYMTMCIR